MSNLIVFVLQLLKQRQWRILFQLVLTQVIQSFSLSYSIQPKPIPHQIQHEIQQGKQIKDESSALVPLGFQTEAHVKLDFNLPNVKPMVLYQQKQPTKK